MSSYRIYMHITLWFNAAELNMCVLCYEERVTNIATISCYSFCNEETQAVAASCLQSHTILRRRWGVWDVWCWARCGLWCWARCGLWCCLSYRGYWAILSGPSLVLYFHPPSYIISKIRHRILNVKCDMLLLNLRLWTSRSHILEEETITVQPTTPLCRPNEISSTGVWF